MSKILKSFFFNFIFLTHFIATCYGQNNIVIPKSFKETIPPKAWSDNWYKLNYSKNEYKVEITNSKLQIGIAKHLNECKLEIESGTLVGTNGGEFGGKLIFIPKDKSKSDVKIIKANILFLFQFKGKIYFISGLLHMSFNGGGMFELKPEGDNFSVQKVMDFESAPMAFTIYKDTLLIAADKGFYVIKDLKKQLIFDNLFWEGLYPNSIAVLNDKNILVGIRSGIVKLDLNTKRLRFYMKI
ncbi:MAG: hypothetical protein REI96_20875 [Flavobacterium nitrogenifigens]|uniref:hypothetical protein n=1 Tax=Flavobacterium nitrogenifigens TaxID=1617283 RepID=UPI00280742C8|nr:hypothetical protein [Flavobacterium nitrogenifigens]MDQ8014912.1 hypothetical protein [Flavobacterium nitrogenifigens]